MRTIVLLLVAMILGAAAPAASPSPLRPVQILVVDGALWVRGAVGELKAIDLKSGAMRTEADANIVGMTRFGARLYLLKAGSADRTYSVEVRENGQITLLPDIKTGPLGCAVAILVGPDRLVVASTADSFVYDQAAKTWRALHLTPEMKLLDRPCATSNYAAWSSALTGDGAAYYIGINQGEWGGILKRIDLATGASQTVCGTPTASSCDPVTGVISDPERSDCVLVSLGLSHMLTTGRVSRVCGASVTTVYEKNTGARLPGTLPIFGLSPAGKDFWAVAPSGLLRFDSADKPPEEIKFNTIENLGGLQLDRSRPDVVMVVTDANAAFSLSGQTPLVAARD